MSVLPAFLSRNRDSIVRTLARRAAAWDSDDGREQAHAAKILFQTALVCAKKRNRAPAVDWAAAFRNRSGESRKYSHALRAVQEFERASRRAVLTGSTEIDEIVALLESLAETADLMRLGAAIAWFGGKSTAAKTASEAHARKAAILESSLDPIVTIDHRGVITEFNRAAEHVFKRPRNEVIGTKPSEILFPPAKIEGYQNRIDRYLDVGEGSLLGKRSEVTAVRADGTVFPAEMAMTIGSENGLPVITFFIRDISRQKKAEMERERSRRELERSNRELEQFAYVASHDLQEPLRKIRTFGDRLEQRCADQLDVMGADCLTRMKSAAGRMQTLISDLLTLSRVSTRGQDFVPVNLNSVAEEVLSDLEILIEQQGARVEIGHLPTIEADRLQIRQLLQNLMGNAVKFGRENEPNIVRIHGALSKQRVQRGKRIRREEECRIVVEDQGIGFDEKYLDRIFTVFQRLHPRDVYQGNGVGLAICRRVVERHGGRISARSRLGAGSVFEVTLPVKHATNGLCD